MSQASQLSPELARGLLGSRLHAVLHQAGGLDTRDGCTDTGIERELQRPGMLPPAAEHVARHALQTAVDAVEIERATRGVANSEPCGPLSLAEHDTELCAG